MRFVLMENKGKHGNTCDSSDIVHFKTFAKYPGRSCCPRQYNLLGSWSFLRPQWTMVHYELFVKLADPRLGLVLHGPVWYKAIDRNLNEFNWHLSSGIVADHLPNLPEKETNFRLLAGPACLHPVIVCPRLNYLSLLSQST